MVTAQENPAVLKQIGMFLRNRFAPKLSLSNYSQFNAILADVEHLSEIYYKLRMI